MVCCKLCQRDTGAGAKLAVESVWEVSRLQRFMKMEMTYPVMPIVFLSTITAGWLQVLGGGGGILEVDVSLLCSCSRRICLLWQRVTPGERAGRQRISYLILPNQHARITAQHSPLVRLAGSLLAVLKGFMHSIGIAVFGRELFRYMYSSWIDCCVPSSAGGRIPAPPSTDCVTLGTPRSLVALSWGPGEKAQAR